MSVCRSKLNREHPSPKKRGKTPEMVVLQECSGSVSAFVVLLRANNARRVSCPDGEVVVLVIHKPDRNMHAHSLCFGDTQVPG